MNNNRRVVIYFVLIVEMVMNNKGKIIPNGVILEAHELATVVFFTELGYDIELIPRSNVQGVHKPDMRMDGLEWEIKAPKGEGKSLIKNTLQKATKQSSNVIIDLRRTKRYQDKCIAEITREFNHSSSLKRVKIITKSGKLIDITKS